MFTLEQLIKIYPESLWCAIAPTDRATATQAEQQPYSHDGARWRAYLNTLCLECLKRELPIALEIQEPLRGVAIELPQRWELLTGLPITLGGVTLVIIPTDRPMVDELRVPCEWVDIEGWAAPYYVSCQVDLEDNWLRIMGYATHSQLKQGTWDRNDRTYSLPMSDLNENLSTLWLLREYYPDPQPIGLPLPALLADQVTTLLHQLGQPSPYSPRLLCQDTEDTFTQWLAFIADPARLEQLYLQRTTIAPQSASQLESTITRVSDSLVELKRQVLEVFGEGWNLLSELMNPPEFTMAIVAKGSSLSQIQLPPPASKRITLNGQNFNLAVQYSIPTDRDETFDISAEIKVNSADPQVRLPIGLTLKVRDRDHNLIDGDRVTSEETYNQLEASIFAPSGEEYVIELLAGTDTSTLRQNFPSI